ncbi:M14 family metallopeptidase [Paenibacillus xylaniclasticus]|uniref:M14 family metallopeptidase n=1 Tax=Paenibacillus xylaniclasticus TaxID=588083 RepID=UPI001FE5E584|nr:MULTISPECIES: M14 family metallocarboxypeptidase [Paenibacillus]
MSNITKHIQLKPSVRLLSAIAISAAVFAASVPSPAQAAAQTASVSNQSIVNPMQVYSYTRMSKDLQALAARYPDLITLDSAGKSEYGRTLWMADIGHGPAVILLNGAHHAREWITTITLMKLLEEMAVQYEKNGTVSGGLRARDLLDRVTFRIVPMVNPDGVTLQQQGLSAFPEDYHAGLIYMNNGSRDFKRWKANARGVDLNRQYPADWAGIRNVSKKPSYMNYKGTKPLQAKEALAMYNLALSTKPEIALSYHSSGEIIYWNFHTKKENFNRDYNFASAYAKLTGYSLVTPQPNPSGGGFTDWFIQQFGRPALTPEIGRAAGSTNVPLTEWSRIWKQHKNTVWMIAEKGYELWLKRQTAAKSTSDVRLLAAEKGYQFPELRAKTMGTVYEGRYKTLRQKGDWLEIATSNGPRWISSRSVIQGPFEQTNDLTVSLTKQTVHYATPLSTQPSAVKLQAQTAVVRERWNDWLYVAAAEGMIWIREADLPEGALITIIEEQQEETETQTEEETNTSSEDETITPTEGETTSTEEPTEPDSGDEKQEGEVSETKDR